MTLEQTILNKSTQVEVRTVKMSSGIWIDRCDAVKQHDVLGVNIQEWVFVCTTPFSYNNTLELTSHFISFIFGKQYYRHYMHKINCITKTFLSTLFWISYNVRNITVFGSHQVIDEWTLLCFFTTIHSTSG